MKNKCHARTKKGRACSVGAVKGTKFCLLHTVDESTGLTQAQIIGRWGGTRRTLTISRKGETAITRFKKPKSIQEQAAILALLQVEVHDGLVPTRVATTIATLANAYINAMEVADFAEKLRDLEKRMGLESPIDRLEEEIVQ
jgi:hypothetical protein